MEHFTSRLSRHSQELVNVYMCVGGGEGMVVVGYPIGPPPCDTNINLTKCKTCYTK